MSLTYRVLRHKIKVQWVSSHEEKEGAYTRQKDIIVLLRFRQNLREVQINALLAYLREETLPHTRSFLPPAYFTALVWVLALLVTEETKEHELSTYLRDQLSQLIAQDQALASYLQKIWSLYEKGLLIPVLLRELDAAGNSLLWKVPPHAQFCQEAEDLLDFLYFIAVKEKGEDVPLKLTKKFFRFSLILVAREDVSLTGHIRRAKEALEQGYTVYVAGMGTHIDDAKYVAQRLQEEGFQPIGGEARFQLPPPIRKLTRVFAFTPKA